MIVPPRAKAELESAARHATSAARQAVRALQIRRRESGAENRRKPMRPVARRAIAQNMSPIVKAEELSKVVPLASQPGQRTAGQLVILQDIDLEVRPGEAVAVVGASGSGKSTLLGLLAGLDVPSSGRVQLDGKDLFALDEDGRAALRARLLGFVFQAFQLLAALNALENVMLPLELAGEERAAALSLAMLERVGLGERLRHYPKYLSGGEQQRVALARAFVVKPKLLLADEPTGNLDASTGAGVIDLLFELNAEQGTTLVLVTHDEALARRCDRIIRLAGGRIVG
jgi:putative ABC transport system ATP-binding protein